MAEHDDEWRRTEEQVQRCYSTWGASYYDEYPGPGAPYPLMQIDLLRRLVLDSGAKTVLDAGCGPASFLRYLLADGVDLYGFDLTAEMVAEAKRVFAERSLDPSHVWQGSVLGRDAFRPRTPGVPEAFDAAVCVGVLPHVAKSSEPVLFSHLHDAVRAGELTERSAEAGPIVGDALERMQAHFRMDLPPVRRGKVDEPGYDEVLSRTHNPLTLRTAFEAAGFRDVRVLFYHFHARPPMFEATAPGWFREASVAMKRADDWRGSFMASAFLLVGTRA